MSLVSVPTHWTLSNQIRPAPVVTPEVMATAPVQKQEKCEFGAVCVVAVVCVCVCGGGGGVQ